MSSPSSTAITHHPLPSGPVRITLYLVLISAIPSLYLLNRSAHTAAGTLTIPLLGIGSGLLEMLFAEVSFLTVFSTALMSIIMLVTSTTLSSS
ncbi:hypothetical protein DL95DRAFT_397833, partial [Leptodontidium sp. 2 PMI_412]